jgi:hypothetical protein
VDGITFRFWSQPPQLLCDFATLFTEASARTLSTEKPRVSAILVEQGVVLTPLAIDLDQHSSCQNGQALAIIKDESIWLEDSAPAFWVTLVFWAVLVLTRFEK